MSKMKTRFWMIIGTSITIIGLLFVYSLQNIIAYNDNNIYNVSAKIIHSESALPIICPTHFQLSIKSENPVVLEEYLICNGFSCIKHENMHHDIQYSPLIPLFGIESWKTGETITIKLGVSTLYDEHSTHPQPITRFIDLGHSMIEGNE